MNGNRLVLIALAAATLLSIVIFAGCDPLPYEGTQLPPSAPQVFWSDRQIATQNSQNPVLTWYSTDADGKVLDYQFTVLFDSTVTRLGGVAAIAADFPDGYTWTTVHTDSSTIPLYASSDTSEYVPQYVFIKAMDDDSLYSAIIYFFLSRVNHPPTCYLDLPLIIENSIVLGPDPQWCLPDTTASWKGIRVAWVGKDSIDISGVQPDFEWNIRIYGPYADSNSCYLSGDIPDTAWSKLYREYPDSLPNTGEKWIRDKEKRLVNLETGWYWMYARNRDDAFVSSIPALGLLSVFEPTWIRHPELTKDILIANHSWYAPTTPLFTTAGNLRTTFADSVRLFYEQLLIDAGYGPETFDWANYTVGNQERQVPKSDLYNHRLILILDTDITKPLEEDAQQETSYRKYLDVGGKVWIVGRRTFDTPSPGWQEMPASPAAGEHSIAYTHFGLDACYSPSQSAFETAEFIGAFPVLAGYPELLIDTLRVAQASWSRIRMRGEERDTVFTHYAEGEDWSFFAGLDIDTTINNFPPPPDTIIDTTRCNVYHYYVPALIGIDFLARFSDAETIFKFKSISPDTSLYHNFPVAIRKEIQGSYKTSYFCFPLYFIKTDQALALTQEMLDWFFEN